MKSPTHTYIHTYIHTACAQHSEIINLNNSVSSSTRLIIKPKSKSATNHWCIYGPAMIQSHPQNDLAWIWRWCRVKACLQLMYGQGNITFSKHSIYRSYTVATGLKTRQFQHPGYSRYGMECGARLPLRGLRDAPEYALLWQRLHRLQARSERVSERKVFIPIQSNAANKPYQCSTSTCPLTQGPAGCG